MKMKKDELLTKAQWENFTRIMQSAAEKVAEEMLEWGFFDGRKLQWLLDRGDVESILKEAIKESVRNRLNDLFAPRYND